MREFKVSELITLKLEGDKTIIYVDGMEFRQCKYLLLNIPVEKISSFDEIASVDEAAERLDHSEEPRKNTVKKIPPEVEFWGHCSNLQAWVENSYDTRIIHSNLAFPLLRALLISGDPIAERVVNEEVAKKLMRGTFNTIRFLILEGYFDYLSDEEVQTIVSGETEKSRIEKKKISFKHMNFDALGDDIHGMTLKQFDFLINHPKFDFLADFQEHFTERFKREKVFEPYDYIVFIFHKLIDLEERKKLRKKYFPLLKKLRESL
ncbi:MAG: hypothetical protein CEE42_09540 [Promethearchaeota archaeon Loki_b31]|nr:MAG: hypothetical protein CEE42_09540 [Candidatus Lokiarchaeota archaeon Loki_b31]